MKYRVQKHAIEGLKLLKVFCLENKEKEDRLNRKLLRLERYTLMHSREDNDDKEFGVLWNYKTDEKCNILGDTSSIVMNSTEEAKRLIESSESGSLVFIHSHPSDNFLSKRDIQSFVSAKYLVIVVAVGNNGSISTLSKLDNVDISSLRYLVNKFLGKDKDDIGLFINDSYFEYKETLFKTIEFNQSKLGVLALSDVYSEEVKNENNRNR